MKKETTTSVYNWLNHIGVENINLQTSYGVICNPDQSVRWIWPAHAKTPIFLKLYTVSGLKSQLFYVMCHLVFKLRLQRLLFKHIEGSAINFNLNINIDSQEDWAIFTGTPGPNRKLVLTGSTLKGENFFAKIPFGSWSNEKLNHEYLTLLKLGTLNLESLDTPKPFYNNSNPLQINDLSNGSRSKVLSDVHILGLKELRTKTASSKPLIHTHFWQELCTLNDKVKGLRDDRIPSGVIRKINLLLKSINKEQNIDSYIAHGDFTPWNCFITDNKLSVYDWELSLKEAPIGFDAIHFVVQSGLLQNKYTWAEIQDILDQDVLEKIFDKNRQQYELHVKLYLAFTVLSSLYLYAHQAQWHKQVSWLLTGWSNGISSFLSTKISHRKLLLIDLFDHLHDTPYATLKFHAELPESLSQYSDIDMCIARKDAKKLNNYLTCHPLTKSVKARKQSFMQNFEVFTCDNQIISIDCISSFRRKGLIYGDCDEVINTSIKSNFGIRKACIQLESDYINSFYVLNNTEVPERYKSYFFEFGLKMSPIYRSSNSLKRTLSYQLKTLPKNKGLHRTLNRVGYVFDTIRGLINNQGYLVTFTGVDGAGKTTLINITSQRIEKQLRKPVVLLRHRPSILPIISRLFHGKEGAQSVSNNHNPHDGKNTNKIGSILRFMYYLVDYVLGQYVVYFKHTVRGKVVIYDRYYYDFICDPKRSNIVMPKWVATLGMSLIRKPKINFFIYADAEVIRARKEELSKDKIIHLTNNYRQLFSKLSDKSSATFESIENTNLEFTTKKIMRSISLKTG